MATLERAIEIAARVHSGQTDKAGGSYILHPLRLMMRMDDEVSRITAVLHDVIEDSQELPEIDRWNFERLCAEGFSPEVLDALARVTRLDKNESYEDFIERARPNATARKVKIADLEDNMNILRLKSVTEKDMERLRKYHKAWLRLKETTA